MRFHVFGKRIDIVSDDFVPVSFSQRPVTGLQIAAMVQQLISQYSDHSDKLVFQMYRHGGLIIGQVSSELHRHMRVVLPNNGPDFLLEDWYYTGVAIVFHEWTTTHAGMLVLNEDEVDNSTKAFADALQQAYYRGLDQGFPEFNHET